MANLDITHTCGVGNSEYLHQSLGHSGGGGGGGGGGRSEVLHCEQMVRTLLSLGLKDSGRPSSVVKIHQDSQVRRHRSSDGKPGHHSHMWCREQ